METITAKQVEGAVDSSTDQNIAGVKSFTSPVNFFPNDSLQFACLRVEGLYLYWIKEATALENEGNYRFGPSQSLSSLTFQIFQEGKWKEFSPGDIFN